MKRLIGAVFLSAYVLAAIGLAGTPVTPKSTSTTTGDFTKGRLFLPETEFDFGHVPQGVYVSHSFWMLNVGVDTLEIIQIKPG